MRTWIVSIFLKNGDDCSLATTRLYDAFDAVVEEIVVREQGVVTRID